MKRPAKMILFIAIAAVTFGSLNYFIGRNYCDRRFRNHNGYERPWQDNKPPANSSAEHA